MKAEYFRGKRIDKLTRKELIKAVEFFAKQAMIVRSNLSTEREQNAKG